MNLDAIPWDYYDIAVLAKHKWLEVGNHFMASVIMAYRDSQHLSRGFEEAPGLPCIWLEKKKLNHLKGSVP